MIAEGETKRRLEIEGRLAAMVDLEADARESREQRVGGARDRPGRGAERQPRRRGADAAASPVEPTYTEQERGGAEGSSDDPPLMPRASGATPVAGDDATSPEGGSAQHAAVAVMPAPDTAEDEADAAVEPQPQGRCRDGRSKPRRGPRPRLRSPGCSVAAGVHGPRPAVPFAMSRPPEATPMSWPVSAGSSAMACTCALIARARAGSFPKDASAPERRFSGEHDGD